MALPELIGGIVAIAGSAFLFLGALGVVRMPDLYNRIQAGTKATTLGTLLFLAGIGITLPGWLAKLAVLMLFIVFTNPVSSHVLARAAHHIGVPMSPCTVVDHLRDGAPSAPGAPDGASSAPPVDASTSPAPAPKEASDG